MRHTTTTAVLASLLLLPAAPLAHTGTPRVGGLLLAVA